MCVCVTFAERIDISSDKRLLWQKVLTDIKSAACVSSNAMTMFYKGIRFLMNDLEESGLIPEDTAKVLPESYRTTERNFGTTNTHILFDEYYLCEKFHHHEPRVLVGPDGKPRGSSVCQKEQFGKVCAAEIFDTRPSGKVSPKLVHCYRGIAEGLRPLLSKTWFLEGLEEHLSMPEFEEKVHYEYYTSTRFAKFKERFLKRQQNALKVLIVASGDWCALHDIGVLR